MERFDAIVVGAGPAGSTAAYRLADAGASVLLADRARFPRDKPCGGGLTGRAVRLLPVSVDPVVEDVVDTFELRLGYGPRRFERRSQEPLVLMTQRRRLDAHLAERAAEAGADFRDGVKVADIETGPGGVRATVAGNPVSAAVLIGADGTNGTTARAVGLAGERQYGVALEGNVPYDAADRRRYGGRAVLELGVVAGGYGWVFPKGDHVNVGVGGWEWEGAALRDHLRRLCDAHGLSVDTVSGLRGFRLPMRRPNGPLARGRALLVGDAAGLVDPLSGDGMYEAFLSARLAAETVLDVLAGRARDVEAYAARLVAAVGPHAAASWGMKIALDRFPRLAFAVARTPPAWRVVDALIRGEMSDPSAARGLGRAAMRTLDALARRAGDPGRGYRAELQLT